MSVRHSVLLVDENAQARRHMVAILRGVFAQVYEAEDYESALCLFSKHRPDMVITAIKEYPAVLEFIGRICGQEPAAVIVALIEARVPAAKLIGSVNAGVTGFLRKPATLNDLRALSARLLSGAELRRHVLFPAGSVSNGAVDLVIRTEGHAVNELLRIISGMLAGVVDGAQLAKLFLAIDESVRNAYEHGNLGLTSEQKLSLCEEETLESYLQEKEQTPALRAKQIRVQFACSKDEVSCVIEDEGDGFDWRQSALPAGENGELMPALGGRGLALIRHAFDSVEFNEKGNKITLRKRLAGG